MKRESGFNREAFLVAAAGLALLMVTFWSYGRFSAARQRAIEDGDAWAQSDLLSGQIKTLRDQPALANDRALQQDDMTQRIADAAASASLDEKKLIAVEHQKARRIGRTAYLEEPTRLTFKDVSLKEVLTSLYALTGDDPRLHVSYLRLAAPRGEGDPMLWSADATVTYLIYDPIAKP